MARGQDAHGPCRSKSTWAAPHYDEGEQLEGCDILPSDFEHCDRELFRELLTGILAQADVVEGTFAPFVDRDLEALSRSWSMPCSTSGATSFCAARRRPGASFSTKSAEPRRNSGSGYRFTNAVLERVAREVRKDEVGAETPAS